jgi:hypothetical protein
MVTPCLVPLGQLLSRVTVSFNGRSSEVCASLGRLDKGLVWGDHGPSLSQSRTLIVCEDDETLCKTRDLSQTNHSADTPEGEGVSADIVLQRPHGLRRMELGTGKTNVL